MNWPEALLRLVQCSSPSILVFSCVRFFTAPLRALSPTGLLTAMVLSLDGQPWNVAALAWFRHAPFLCILRRQVLSTKNPPSAFVSAPKDQLGMTDFHGV